MTSTIAPPKSARPLEEVTAPVDIETMASGLHGKPQTLKFVETVKLFSEIVRGANVSEETQGIRARTHFLSELEKWSTTTSTPKQNQVQALLQEIPGESLCGEFQGDVFVLKFSGCAPVPPGNSLSSFEVLFRIHPAFCTVRYNGPACYVLAPARPLASRRVWKSQADPVSTKDAILASLVPLVKAQVVGAEYVEPRLQPAQRINEKDPCDRPEVVTNCD